MTRTDETLDARFQRLTAATAELRARPGFTDRVMVAAEAATAPLWLESVSVSARSVFAVALLMAVSALGLAIYSDWAATEASAVAYGTMEVDWQ
jgi:hypothetical protein